MSLEIKLIISIAIACIFGVMSVRSLLKEIAIFHLGKDVVKERKKGQTFKEWFTYSRFSEVIPDRYIRLYNITVIIFFGGFIAYMFVYVLKFPPIFEAIIQLVMFIFGFILIGIYKNMSRERYHEPKKYKHRITKKQGQQPCRKRKK